MCKSSCANPELVSMEYLHPSWWCSSTLSTNRSYSYELTILLAIFIRSREVRMCGKQSLGSTSRWCNLHPHWPSAFSSSPWSVTFPFAFLVGTTRSKRRKRRESKFSWYCASSIRKSGCGNLLGKLCLHVKTFSEQNNIMYQGLVAFHSPALAVLMGLNNELLSTSCSSKEEKLIENPFFAEKSKTKPFSFTESLLCFVLNVWHKAGAHF